ncbi:hypothetical protein ECMP0209401_0447 [Escherichia coli MP020940.1]|nr:hypothetical protein CSC11_1898 [Escherichia coli]EGB89077.1 hypothetical protein HMPREF9542_01442 [Escherichia coli MS 117-3]EMX60386.1 hypothetical protein ECMP0209401_0447 [Escherichia coli MP020940.1]EMZ69707.1 hypothetical protein EC174900_0333 [Escherichia coli 174900]EMZ99277.1 hypothetical protein ECP03048161_0124 [Escherichia coli P0304816.1]ENF23460.1 hypothetical protein ECP030481611_0263 [Escherichia coli P0304816.11]ENF26887.1 hypothetical protein ECP030481610_0273 [Escherichi
MVVGDGINTRLIECFTPIIGTINFYLIDLINVKFIQSEIA